MEIIEQFIKGKKQDQNLCEDFLFVGDSFIAVIDGVTSKSDADFDGKKGGRAAAEIICKAISEFPEDINAFDAVEVLTKKTASLYAENENYGAAAACVIVFSRFKNEIWCVGDCQCSVNGKVFLHEKEIDGIVSDMRALVIEIGRRKGMTDRELYQNDIGREFILPVIKEQHIFANTDGRFSYGVINGTPVLEKDIIIHKVKNGDEIILASDGYPKLFGTLEESEAYLKHEIEINPFCDGDYRSTKGLNKDCDSFDDRTYIRFRV